MTYIGVGRRAVALIIDALVGFVLAIPIAALTGGFSSGVDYGYQPQNPATHGFSFRLGSGPTLLTVFLWLAYMTLSEANGATLGKLAVGIRVRKEDGGPMDLGASVTRNLFRLIDGIFAYLLGAIFVWNSPKRQRLGDRVAHTVVVPKDFVGMAQAVPGMPAPPSGPPPVPPPPPPGI